LLQEPLCFGRPEIARPAGRHQDPGDELTTRQAKKGHTFMETTQQLSEQRLADAWAELQAHSSNGNALQADAYRLAFADPEFLLRRETRGIRFQLELLKPDLAQSEQGIDNTVVVYGSARLREPALAREHLAEAQASGDARAIARAKTL